MPVDGHWTIEAVEVPMPLDTLIKVGMLADVEGHGDRIPIKRISVALCPRRDPAAEDSERALAGRGDADEQPVTAAEVEAIEAVMLPYAVFDFGEGGWGYGRQIRRVYNEDGSEHEG
jgi:hypothetical protein